MSRVETKDQAFKIVQKYSKELKRVKFPFSEVYLFGSFVKNKNHKWSDIDVAVVSDVFEKNEHGDQQFLLWKIRRKVDIMIEPIGFSKKDFKEESNPLVAEIKKSGIKV